MGRITFSMSVSLDGFFENATGGLDWQLVDDELHTHFNDVYGAMGAFLDGRVTWELMAGFWPTADEDPENTGPVAEFAGIWRCMPKVVFSRTLTEADWNTDIERNVTVETVEAIRARTSGDIAVGGARLGAAFRELGLIDEYRLYVHPVLLGEGRRLFEQRERPYGLRLVENRTFGNGVVMLSYRTT